MGAAGAWHCVEGLGLLVSTGRSSEFGFARRVARAPLSRAAATRAEEIAADWERSLAALAGRGAGLARIDEAVALAPRDARWRAYRALGLLLARPASEYGCSAKRGHRVARAARARASAEEALREARAGARLDPRFALSFIIAGLACSELERPSEAARWFGRAHALAPREGWILLARAAARLRAGDLSGFAADATAAHYLDEGAGALRFAGRERRPGSERAGISAATRLLASRPRAAWALALRADLKRFPVINDFAGALADLEAAARLAPREAWIQAHLSRARVTAGDPEGALAAVSAAARLRPDCGWIRAWKGEVLRHFRRFPQAKREFDAALRLDPDYEFAYARRGGTLRALGLLEEALADLSVAAVLEPANAWILLERSCVLRGLGRIDEALDDLESARRLDPKSAWCPRAADAPAAIAELDRHLMRRPDDARALAWRGETRLRAADAEGAARDLSRAAALAPGSAWARAVFGEALAALGRPAEAVREFDAALAADPCLAEASARRARARLDAGDFRGALADFAAAAAREPRAAWIHAGRGEAALKLRRWDEAREAYRQARALDPRSPDPRTVLSGARKSMIKPVNGLVIAGLGVDPPATATIEGLSALERCDVIYCALEPAAAARLKPYLRGLRPAPSAAKLAAAAARRRVGLAVWGHPGFSALARGAAALCRKKGTACAVVPGNSPALTVLAKAPGFIGGDWRRLQTFPAEAVIADPSLVIRGAPLVVFAESSWGGPGRLAAALVSRLNRRAPATFYPHRGESSTRLRVGDLSALDALGPGSLFVPGRAILRRRNSADARLPVVGR